MKIKKSYLAIGAAVLLLGSSVVFSEPGDENDPLVTLSYVNRSIEQVKSYIDTKLGSAGGNTDGVDNSLEVVNVSRGQFLIADAGTEIILRSGNATAVISDLGGLSDVTAGVDIGKDVSIPSNHLLIIPRDDGRGVHCSTDSIFLVRGGYQIK
jgi:hypothetical protein